MKTASAFNISICYRALLPLTALIFFGFAHRSAHADAIVSFSLGAYSPNEVTIAAGESVIWNGTFSSHPLQEVTGETSDTPASGGFEHSSGLSFSQIFNTPGTYYYRCTNHGIFSLGGTMRGKVVVTAGGTPV